jgi:hypothetical protein
VLSASASASVQPRVPCPQWFYCTCFQVLQTLQTCNQSICSWRCCPAALLPCCPAALLPCSSHTVHRSCAVSPPGARHSTAKSPKGSSASRHTGTAKSHGLIIQAQATGTAHLNVTLSCAGPSIHTHTRVGSQAENHALDAGLHLHGETCRCASRPRASGKQKRETETGNRERFQ